MEVRDGVAAVFREDGAVVKLRQNCRVGDTVDLPELPQESARNAWQKVSALGAKLTEFPSRLKHEPDEPVPDTTEMISPDAADFGATAVISDTVREALDTETEIISDGTPTTKITLDKPSATSGEPSATFGVFDAPSTPEVTFDAPRTNETTFDAPPANETTFDAPRNVFAPADDATEIISDTIPPREPEADITSGTVWDIPDAPRDVAGVISDTVDAPKKTRKPQKAPLFPAGLHVLDTIKERVSAVKTSGDSETKHKSSKKGWWQDSRFRAGIAAALAVAILSGSVMYNTAMACAYVALDVDESAFEFSVNRMGRVIAVNAISPDARGLAQSLQSGVKNKTVDEAVTYTMGVLRDAGYLEDAKGEIIASVTSNAEKRSMELTQTVAQSVEGNKQNGVKLYLMEASRNDRGAALARHLSPGRYLIQRSGDLLRPTLDTGASAETLDAPDTPAVPDTPAAPDTPDMSAVEGLPTVSGAAAAQPERQLRPVLGTGSGAASGTVTTPGTPAATTPGTSATTTPGTPAATTPGTSATTTPGTPAATTPRTPAATTPGTPAATTPGTSTTTTPGTPAATTPRTSTTTTPRTSTTPTAPKPDTGSTTKKSSNTKPADSGKTTEAPKPVAQPTTPQPEPVTPAPQPTPVQPEPIAQPEPEPAPDITPAPEPEPEPESTPRQVEPEPEPEPESKPAPRHSEPEPEQLWSNDTPSRKPAEPSGNDGGETVTPKRDSGETAKSEPRDNGDTKKSEPRDDGETVQTSKPDKPDTSEASSPARSDGGDTVAPKPSQPEPEPEAVTPPPANDGDGELYTPDET